MKIRETVSVIGIGKEFLDKIPEMQEIKLKINKQNDVKLQSFYMAKKQ